MSLGAYIHIPFCNYQCHYCDFATVLNNDTLQKQYTAVLIKEIDERLDSLNYKPELISIYYGGGTPGAMHYEFLAQIHNHLLEKTSLTEDTEITLETTPETISLEKASQWKELGINRLSIGIETFNDSLLKRLGRGHSSAQAKQAVHLAMQAGFNNINCDLMYGLPYQNLGDFEKSVNSFIDLASTYSAIKHLSAYGLELNPNGNLAKIIPTNSGHYPSDDLFIKQQISLINILSHHGFEQYEISNFAKSGALSKHNLNYWLPGEYLAFGVSAHRYLKPFRSSNWRNINQYLLDPLGNESNELIKQDTEIKENIMLGLRMNKGINLNRFENKFGFDLSKKYQKVIDKLTANKVIIIENNHLKLTIAGQSIANSIISEFF